MITYKNSFYKPKEHNLYSPENFTYNPDTGQGITEYKGYTIYARWDRFALCYDIVKDGVCIAQYAGARGAQEAIDKIIAGEYKTGYPGATKIASMEDLPAKGYTLPNWKQIGRYRATAWAYLNREDGGLLVYSEGTAYKL